MSEMDTNQTQLNKKGISGSTLKIIAMVTMLIDHIGAVVLEVGYMPYLLQNGETMLYEQWANVDTWMRLLGRMAFPIFCFLLVEGFHYTKSVPKYLGRLLLFALISEVPFDLAICKTTLSFAHQNVYFTLFFGLLAIALYDRVNSTKCNDSNMKRRVLSVIAVVGCGILAVLCHTDYDMAGVLLIVVLYMFRNIEPVRNFAASIAMLGAGLVEIAGYIAFIPMHFYNGERGLKLKYIFYVFYPLHLLLLVYIRTIICN